MTNDKRIIFILVCLGCMTISFNVAAVAAAIPAISASLRLPDFLVSKIISFYMIPYGLSALMYAPMTNKISYRRILAVSLFGYALACFYCGTIQSLGNFLVGQIIMGVTAAGSIPLGLMVIGQFFEKEIRGRLVGIFFGSSFIASLAGILLSGVADWRWLFFVPAGMGFVTAAGFAFLKSDLLDRKHGVRVSYLKSFKVPRIRQIFLFIFVISFLYHGVFKWFGVYLDKIYHLDKFAISLFFMMIAIASAAGQMAGGILSDKKGRQVSCLLGVLILGAATIALYFHHPLWALGIILCLTGAGWTIGHNGLSTVLTDFPDDHRAEIASLNSAVRFVSGGLGFFATIPLVEKSFGLTFLGIGVLMLLTAPYLKKIISQH